MNYQKIVLAAGGLIMLAFLSSPVLVAHYFRPQLQPAPRAEMAQAIQPAPPASRDVRQGEQLFVANCAICHNLDGAGKIGMAPSIGNRDFLALASDEFIKKTVREGRVGTAMVPRTDLTPAQLEQIIAYLRSLPGQELKPIPVDPLKTYAGDPEKGAVNFASYCAPCHGPHGEGYTVGGSGPGIGLPGFLSVVSDDYIFQTVKRGRLGTPMRSFIGARGLANLQEGDVHDIIAFLRQQNPAAQAHYAEDMGKALFERNCAMCHQPEGRGKPGLAPSIGNRDFLALASDEFIRRTVRRGRVGTAMAPRHDLTEGQLEQIIAYLRSLPGEKLPPIHVDPDKQYDGNGARGRELFATYCSPCHGPRGEGYTVGGSGPGIGLPGFLSVVEDDFIFKTVKYGRTGTAMRPFIGARGLANLQEEDVHDIIAFLKGR